MTSVAKTAPFSKSLTAAEVEIAIKEGVITVRDDMETVKSRCSKLEQPNQAKNEEIAGLKRPVQQLRESLAKLFAVNTTPPEEEHHCEREIKRLQGLVDCLGTEVSDFRARLGCVEADTKSTKRKLKLVTEECTRTKVHSQETSTKLAALICEVEQEKDKRHIELRLDKLRLDFETDHNAIVQLKAAVNMSQAAVTESNQRQLDALCEAEDSHDEMAAKLRGSQERLQLRSVACYLARAVGRRAGLQFDDCEVFSWHSLCDVVEAVDVDHEDATGEARVIIRAFEQAIRDFELSKVEISGLKLLKNVGDQQSHVPVTMDAAQLNTAAEHQIGRVSLPSVKKALAAYERVKAIVG